MIPDPIQHLIDDVTLIGLTEPEAAAVRWEIESRHADAIRALPLTAPATEYDDAMLTPIPPISSRKVTIEITGVEQGKPLICDDDLPATEAGGLGAESARKAADAIYRKYGGGHIDYRAFKDIHAIIAAEFAALAHAPEPDTLRERVSELADEWGKVATTTAYSDGELVSLTYESAYSQLRALLQPPA